MKFVLLGTTDHLGLVCTSLFLGILLQLLCTCLLLGLFVLTWLVLSVNHQSCRFPDLQVVRLCHGLQGGRRIRHDLHGCLRIGLLGGQHQQAKLITT